MPADAAARGGLALLALGGLLALAAPAAGQTVLDVDEDIVGDVTWQRVDGIYLVNGQIEVAEGARLTVAPGVVVKFRRGGGLMVRGTLLAIGAPGDTIYFTSEADDNIAGDLPADGPTNPAPGDWLGIAFADSGSDASVMQHCEVWFGGGGEGGALIMCDGASPSLGQSSLNGGNYGVACTRGAAPRLSGVRINGCLSVPLALSPDSDPRFDAVVFGAEQDNGFDGIGLLASSLEEDARLPRRDTQIGTTLVENVTYVLLGTIEVGKEATLRLQPGLVLKAVDAGAGFHVSGRLEAEGTADSAIVFTSVRDDAVGGPWDTNRDESLTAPAPGDWRGIVFADSSSGALRSCRVRFGGVEALVEAGLEVDLAVRDCVLADGRRGLRAGEGTSLTFTGNEVRTCAGVPLEIAVGASLTQADNRFLGNGITAVGLLPGAVGDGGLIRRLDIGGFAGISYYVDGRLGAAGSLTIEPGVTLKFAPGATGIDVAGSLVAAGYPGGRIVLTSVHNDCAGTPGDTEGNGWEPGPCPGDWGGIRFDDGCDATASRLEYCIFSFGGFGPAGVVRIGGVAPTIANCLFEWNLIGLHAEFFAGTAGKAAAVRASDGPWRPAVAGVAEVHDNVFGSNVIPVLYDYEGRLTQDTLLEPSALTGEVPVVHRLAGDLIVPFGITLTLAPGLHLEVGQGGILVRGALVADAPPDNPIEISGLEPADLPRWVPGELVDWTEICWFVAGCDYRELDPLGLLAKAGGAVWRGITFENTSDDAVSILRNLFLRGTDTALTVRNASPVFSAVSIIGAEADGIRIEGRSRPVIEDCAVSRCGRVALAMSLMADPVLSGNAFVQNGYEGIGVLGETLARDCVLRGRDVAQRRNLPYLILEDLAVGAGVGLTLEPGLKLKFLPERSLTVAHSLVARGGAAPESLIVFTSVADDFYGGDSNRDGADTEGGDAPWGGVRLARTTAVGEIALRNCVFRYAGAAGGEGALDITGTCSPTLEACTFAHNARGIVFREAAGDPLRGGLTRCDFFGNREYAALNLGLAHRVRAIDCWWGHASGPFDISDDRYAGGLLNRAGLGDPVSDGVDYAPWLTVGSQPVLLGDVSQSAEVTAYDAALVLQGVIGELALTPGQVRLADVTCAEGVTALDAACILRLVAGLTTWFPCESESVVTRAAGERPLDLSAADAAVHLETLGEGAQGVRHAVAWSGTTPLLAAELVLRAGAGARIVAVAAAPGAAAARFLTRAPRDGEVRIVLASAEPLPAGALVEFELVDDVGDPADAGSAAAVTLTFARLNERTVVRADGGADGPSALRILMEQNRPNPFNPATVIRFALAGPAGATVPALVTVHDPGGRLIRTLVAGEFAPGTHEVRWDGRDDGGARVASGVYFYRVEAGEQRLSRKMTLLK